jgi:hypothetical protein
MGNPTSLESALRFGEGWHGPRRETERMQVGERDDQGRPRPFLVSEPEAKPVPALPAANAADTASEARLLYSPPAVRDFVPLKPPPPERVVVRKVVAPRPPARWPKTPILAGAAVGLLILGTYLAHRPARAAAPAPVAAPPVEHLDLAEVNALPDPLPATAQAALAGTLQAPAWMRSFDQDTGGELGYPVREAVEEVQPTLRWSSFTEIYHVAVLDQQHRVVAKAELYGDTQWTVPVELQRGAIYMWELASPGNARRSTFRVLDDAEAGLLEGLRANHPQAHLILGVALLQLGLRTSAQNEFGALVQEKPYSPEAAQLLRAANTLR